jgi:carbon monoxide dehydrogenase subunit G
MKLEGSQHIAADRETVWAALNDPEVLKACIPGCQSLEKTSDTEFAATVKQKVGPVSATFQGNVTLENLNPPESYRISGEGKGGAAGFAKGGADVALKSVDGGTELTYDAEAKVGGKIAQLGARLIHGFASKMAAQFFETFKAQVEGASAAPQGGAEGLAAETGHGAPSADAPPSDAAPPAGSAAAAAATAPAMAEPQITPQPRPVGDPDPMPAAAPAPTPAAQRDGPSTGGAGGGAVGDAPKKSFWKRLFG